jgi:sugar fermentation stimulation protein A
MLFSQPLVPGRLLRRYKRFLAEVELEGVGATTVHVPNPGAMLGLNAPGARVWCSISSSPSRKLPHTLEIVEADGGLVGVNTLAPNRLVAEALETGVLTEFTRYAGVRREVAIGEGSRIDFLLEAEDKPPLLVEVKNCHLRRKADLAEFPDCIAARSARHARHLARLAAGGRPAAMLFVVQRNDCGAFAPAEDIDPDFARALRTAREAGVAVLAYRCEVSLHEIRITRPLPCRL